MIITATGSALPHLSVGNDELTKFLDTSDEWIVSRTGIRSRRVLTDETLTDLGGARRRKRAGQRRDYGG